MADFTVTLDATEVTEPGDKYRRFRLRRGEGHYIEVDSVTLLHWGVDIPDRTHKVTVELTEEELRARAQSSPMCDGFPDLVAANKFTAALVAANKFTAACRAKVGELDG